ncbi:MAG: HEAT repeat domain-containing protein [Planctomycetaceae bacterium]|nr:HEAT repeat domain-containing protein [Planctomycetaceae bacterium]
MPPSMSGDVEMSDVDQILQSGDFADVCQQLDGLNGNLDPSLIKRLITFIKNGEQAEAVRQKAAEALGRGNTEDSKSALINLSENNSEKVRGLSAIGLGEDRSLESRARLIELLADANNNVRNLAERSLLQMEDLLGEHLQELLALLEHPVPLTRSPAARLLGKSGRTEAREPLTGHLQQDGQWLVRMWSAKALGDLGDKAASPALIQSLQTDERNRVRAAAAEAVGKLRPDGVETILRQALETDEDGGVRKLASEALQALGHAIDDVETDPFAEDD